jgi:hypothetical protein
MDMDLRTLGRLAIALPLATLVACGNGDGADPAGPADDDDTDQMDPVAGRYAITSHFDLSTAEGTPARAQGAIAALAGLADDPAGTMFDLLEAADVPVLDQLLGAIPDALVDQVAGWINDHVVDRVYDGVPVTQQLAGLADDLATALTDFEVMSDLDLGTIDAAGAAGASHMLAAVAFQLDGARREVDTPAIVDQLSVASDVACQVSLASGDDATAGTGHIEIGDHAFHLPLGDFLVVALDQVMMEKYGVPDLRAALELMIDCAALADSVASRCVGIGPAEVCVGHQSEIEAVCDAGLDQVAERVEDQIARIDYAEIRLRAGRADLADEAEGDVLADGVIDRLAPGSWTADLDVDGHALPTTATFTGVR